MAKQKTYGRTASGKPITDEPVGSWERRGRPASTSTRSRRRGARPPLRSTASVESVRLDPELRRPLAERARRDHETTSAEIREALRRYPDAA